METCGKANGFQRGGAGIPFTTEVGPPFPSVIFSPFVLVSPSFPVNSARSQVHMRT